MIKIPENYNYIACFLTFACNFKCHYCINRDSDFVPRRKHLSGVDWINFIQNLDLMNRKDLPVTLSGGEPSCHKDFFYILENLDEKIPLDILTNLQFDLEKFVDVVKPERLDRKAPYANIRVSYHPEQCSWESLKKRVLFLMEKGFRVGVFAIDTPWQKEHIAACRENALNSEIDFRIKDLLGWVDGQLYGKFLYPAGLSRQKVKKVQCRTSELIVGPDGQVYRCHSDLYANRNAIATILAPNFQITDVYRNCLDFGLCNPCDLKIKYNRFQEMGHCSVQILEDVD